MSPFQLVASRAAAVERVVFYTVTPGERAAFDLAVDTPRRVLLASRGGATQFLEQVAGMGLMW